MKRILTPVTLVAALATPSYAQDSESGLSLMERGAQLFMQGIMQEMEPAIEGFQGFAEDVGPALRSFASEMGPALRDLAAQVEDWSVYETPQILPNGDIVIRRKPDAPKFEAKPEAPVDL